MSDLIEEKSHYSRFIWRPFTKACLWLGPFLTYAYTRVDFVTIAKTIDILALCLHRHISTLSVVSIVNTSIANSTN